METPSSKVEHAPKTVAEPASDLIARSIRFVKANATAVVAALAGAALLLNLAPVAIRTVLDFRGSCGIAYSGTSMVVEVDGWRAGAMCREIVQKTKGTQQAWVYLGPSLCSTKWKGYTEYVHDYSPYPLMGAFACAAIALKKAA